jgi:site-specific DNA recombinase
VLQALCDFYANCGDLIADAVARAQTLHRDGRSGWRAEHAAILAQIKAKQNAIERYQAAFENGTMDDATAGQRLKTLHDQISQLTARADELAEAIGSEPAPPPPGVIENLRACLADAIASGIPAERKAAVEALVAEVRITEDGLVPVFRIPSPQPPAPGNADATAREPSVRTMLRLVGPVGLEPTLPGT